MQNLDKPTVGIPETYLNIGDGFNLLIGGVYKLIVGALGTGGMTNASKASIGETWGTISTTWVAESRIWQAASQLISNTLRPNTTVTADSSGNYDAMFNVGGTYNAASQSFTGNGGVLNSVSLRMLRHNNPVGSIYASIYNETHATAFGTNSKPTGSALATSDAVDISTLSTTERTYIPFTFSGANKIMLADGGHYCLVIEWVGNPTSSDTAYVGYSIQSIPGNMAFRIGASWTALTNNLCFYVYTDYGANTIITNQSKP